MKGFARSFANAGATQFKVGVAKQMPVQYPQAAATVSDLKAQFDLLLVKFKDSGLMENLANPSMLRQHINTRGGFGIPTSLSSTTGAYNSFNQRIGLRLTDFASEIQVALQNITSINNGKVDDALADITVECALEVGSVIVPVFWNGIRSKVLTPGQYAVSDKCIVTLPPGVGASVLRTHGLWSLPPASGLPFANGSHTSSLVYDTNSRGTNQLDNTLNPATPTGVTIFGSIFPAAAIIGLTTPAAAIIALGDSNRAWSVSGLATAVMRHINCGCDSFTMSGLNLPGQKVPRFSMVVDGGFTHCFVTIAGGDVTSGATGNTLITRASGLRDYCLAHGLKPVFATTPPKTNAGNTAPKTDEWTAIGTYNNYLRAHNGLGYGYFDLFDQWGSRETGLWRTDLGVPADDGTHANGPLHNVAAAALAAVAPALFV